MEASTGIDGIQRASGKQTRKYSVGRNEHQLRDILKCLERL